jgi:hypothetical protein
MRVGGFLHNKFILNMAQKNYVTLPHKRHPAVAHSLRTTVLRNHELSRFPEEGNE